MKYTPTPQEWANFCATRKVIRYKDIEQVTGIKARTLQNYAWEGSMPRPDHWGVFVLPREDLADWVTGVSRPGAGARSDVYEKIYKEVRESLDRKENRP